jgi:hypothetical protein
MAVPSREELEAGMEQDDPGNFVTNPPPNTDFAKLTLKGTSTTNLARPRTIAAGYDKDTKIMTVVFRGDKENPDGTWWNYYDVPFDMWEDFEYAESKGAYLESSGLNNWPNMGAVNMNAMRPSQKTMLNWVVSQAADAQQRSGGEQVYGDPRKSRQFDK